MTRPAQVSALTYGSVCSGIEAASVAWEPLGWRAAFFSEIEPFPCAVLHHRLGAGRPMFMPDPAEADTVKERKERAAAIRAVARIPEVGQVPNFGDMTQFERWPDAVVDVLVGGTPCQDYSVAGLRLGMAGSRGQLTLTYVEIAARYRPRWFVWENVPGVLSSNGGRDFARFLGDISGTVVAVPEGGWKNSGIVPGIAEAYGLAFRVLDAQYVRTRRHGRAVPQRRRRVFVVGYLGDWRRAAAVLFDRESLRGDPPPRREQGQRPASTLTASVGGCSGKDGIDGRLISMAHGQAGAEIAEGYGPTLTCNHEAPIVAHALRAEGFDASEDGTGRGTPIVPVRAYGMTTEQTPKFGEDHALTLTKQSPTGGGQVQCVAFAFDLRGREGGAMPEGPHDTANIRAADGGSSRSYIAEQHPIAIQERAVCENPNAGPDGAGFRTDGAAYTLEARTVSQAVAFDCRAGGETALAAGEVPGALHGSCGRSAVAFSCKDYGADAADEVSPTMRAMGHGDSHANAGGQLAVVFQERTRGDDGRGYERPPASSLEVCGTLETVKRHNIALPWAVRRLITRECERLQGFPDDFLLIPFRHGLAADGPRYKALGNAMAVNVMEWIGWRIALVDAIEVAA